MPELLPSISPPGSGSTHRCRHTCRRGIRRYMTDGRCSPHPATATAATVPPCASCRWRWPPTTMMQPLPVQQSNRRISPSPPIVGCGHAHAGRMVHALLAGKRSRNVANSPYVGRGASQVQVSPYAGGCQRLHRGTMQPVLHFFAPTASKAAWSRPSTVARMPTPPAHRRMLAGAVWSRGDPRALLEKWPRQ